MCRFQLFLALLVTFEAFVSPLSLQKSPVSRRYLLKVASSAAISSIMWTEADNASAVANPLNLKGSFWETGELYKKDTMELSMEPDQLLEYLVQSASSLGQLSDLVLGGKCGEMSRQLRGGTISESQIRLKAYALIDQIEDETQEYIASDLFRTFLRDLDILDRTVEAASRQSKIDGGAIETLGLAVVSPFGAANEVARIANEPNFGNDSRIQVLATLEETVKTLKELNKVFKDNL